YPLFAGENSKEIVCIDVSTKEGVEILAKKNINIEDFHALNVFQEFNLTFFSSTTEGGLEFRIKCSRYREVNLVIDDITLYDLETQEQVFWEPASDKPQKGPSWYVVEDQDASNEKVVQMDSEVKTESWLYGPYLYSDSYGESLANRKLRATFRLKITDELLPIYVAELSVGVNENKESTDCLAHALIDLSTVKNENIYNTFNLTFTVPTKVTQGIEFQVTNRNSGYCTLLVDEINVYKSNLEELVYSECATSKEVSGEGWVETTDHGSSCLKVMFISSTQNNEQMLYGPQIVSDVHGNSMLGGTYVASFRIKIVKI
ncbi:MAG: hypothetical protein CW716_01290, partial [Candidatus Bathyarchaeum sp.]